MDDWVETLEVLDEMSFDTNDLHSSLNDIEKDFYTIDKAIEKYYGWTIDHPCHPFPKYTKGWKRMLAAQYGVIRYPLEKEETHKNLSFMRIYRVLDEYTYIVEVEVDSEKMYDKLISIGHIKETGYKKTHIWTNLSTPIPTHIKLGDSEMT